MPKSSPELPEEKKQKLLQAAIREFAQNGYELASTNNITKEAGISKGLLFHYFGSKKALFLYLFDQCMSIMETKMNISGLWEETDLFDRLLKASQLKLEAFYENPDLFMLISKAMLHMPAELKADILERVGRTTVDTYVQLTKNIDFSGFREGIDPQKAIGYVLAALEAIAQKYIEGFKDNPEMLRVEAPRIFQEYRELIDIMRYGIYKGSQKGRPD